MDFNWLFCMLLEGAPMLFSCTWWCTWGRWGASFRVNSRENMTISRHFTKLSPWDIPISRHFTKLSPWDIPITRHFMRISPWDIPISRHFMRITRLQKPLSFRKGVGGEALGAHRCTKKQFGAPANDLQVSRLRPKGALSALFFVVHLKDESLQGRDATCHRPLPSATRCYS